MNTWQSVMRTEIGLTWRRQSFWVVQGVWMLPLGLTLITNLGNAMTLLGTRFVSEQVVAALVLWLLLLPLIIGPALTRDLGEVGEVLWATPLDALIHLLGVGAGLFLALLPALLAHLAAQWLVGQVLVGSDALLFWRYGLPLLLASTIAGIGVVAGLALLLRRTLVLLLVWLALWAGTMQVGMSGFGSHLSGALASPMNVFFHHLQLSPSLGLGPARPLVWGLGLWFTGLGLLALLLSVGVALVADRRRAMQRGQLWLAGLVLVGLLAGSGFLLHARAVQAQAIVRSPATIQADLWRVEAQTMAVSVDTARNTLTGTSTLRLAPVRSVAEAAVVLRLNPGLTLMEVSDEAGQPLLWERVGDSLIVELPAPPAEPLFLQFRWQGTPRLSYNDYGARSGYPYPAFDTPQPVRTLLWEGVGYLFRDGDWYPWPWMSGPQQAAESHVTLRVSSNRALASAPLTEGEAVWEGNLPMVLLVLPPASSIQAVGERTLLGGTNHLLATRLTQLAGLAPRLAEAVGETVVPTHIIALPYLHDLVWSDTLLLVPEGTGFVRDDLRRLLLTPPARGTQAAQAEERALMTALARAWLTNNLRLPSGWVRVRADGSGIVAVAGIEGSPEVVRLPGIEDDPAGRWIRSLGSPAYLLPTASGESQQPLVGSGQDLRTAVLTQLTPEDHLNLLALWMAVELAPPDVRAADLAVLLGMPSTSDETARFGPFLQRALPFDFPVGQSQKAALIRALHEWAEVVDREQALQGAGEAIRAQTGTFELAHLLDTLAQQSGLTIEYRQNE